MWAHDDCGTGRHIKKPHITSQPVTAITMISLSLFFLFSQITIMRWLKEPLAKIR